VPCHSNNFEFQADLSMTSHSSIKNHPKKMLTGALAPVQQMKMLKTQMNCTKKLPSAMARG
jgi:hypothetical protein